MQPQGALVGVIGHFGTKNAPEAKWRILCALFLFPGVVWGVHDPFTAQQRDKPQPGLFAPGSERLHCESSDLGLRTEICLKMLARRDDTGLGTEAK